MTARRQKGMVIETFREKMVTAEVRFDKSSKLFLAEHATKKFGDPTLAGLQAKLRAHAMDYQPLTWERVIFVKVGYQTEEFSYNSHGTVRGETRTHRELTLEYWQLERAKDQDTGLYFIRTAEPLEWQLEKWQTEPFHNVTQDRGVNDATVIPYTEVAWNTLEQLAQGLQLLHGRLDDLLSPAKVLSTLNGGIQQLGQLLQNTNPRTP